MESVSLTMQALVDLRDRAEAAEAIVERVEALAEQWSYDVQELLRDFDKTGSDATLSYANCTSMDLRALRAALAGPDVAP